MIISVAENRRYGSASTLTHNKAVRCLTSSRPKNLASAMKSNSEIKVISSLSNTASFGISPPFCEEINNLQSRSMETDRWRILTHDERFQYQCNPLPSLFNSFKFVLLIPLTLSEFKDARFQFLINLPNCINQSICQPLFRFYVILECRED